MLAWGRASLPTNLTFLLAGELTCSFSLSDDEDELERKATEVEQELERQMQQSAPVNSKTGRPARKKTPGGVKPGTASDRDVANAVGSKPPVPKQLQGVHQSELRSRKEAKTSLEKSQDSADRQVLTHVRRSIFQGQYFNSINCLSFLTCKLTINFFFFFFSKKIMDPPRLLVLML